MQTLKGTIKSTIALGCILGASLGSLADENKLAGWAIYLDQDFFVPSKNEDRDYTMGFGIEWFWKSEPQALFAVPNSTTL